MPEKKTTTDKYRITHETQLKGGKNAHKEVANLRRRNVKYERSFASAYKNLIELGMAQRHIMAIFGRGNNVSRSMESSPELQEAYLDGMHVLESKLASRMITQALGYDYDEEKITYVRNEQTKRWRATKKEVSKKHQPGSSAMFMFFMTNRFGENWKQTKEIITKKEGYDSNPSERTRKQITSLARDVLEANSDEPGGEHKLPDKSALVSG